MEQGLKYDAAGAVKQATIMQEATKRYLAALVFAGLNSESHKNRKAVIKHDWVHNNVDSLPKTYK